MRNSSRPEADDALAAGLESALSEAKAAFHLRMRARGIQDRDVLRAFELVPREVFIPPRYLPLAARDLPLPIGCGQTLLEPWLVARMIEALRLDRTRRVLEIGSGSGYATALLSILVRDVIGIERFQSLAGPAQERLTRLGIANAFVVWGDGLAIPRSVERVDRIIVYGLLREMPAALLDRLEVGGILVCARSGEGRAQHIARIEKADNGGFAETPICPCRLQAMISGLSASL